jgi:plastocyanin
MEVRRAWVVSIAMLVLLSLPGCGGDDGGADGGGSGSGLLPDTASLAIADLTFEPTTLTIARGTTTISITNADSVDHTFTLDDGSVDEPISAGGSVDVEVSLQGSIGFHCSIHPQMTGTLQVA